jgi:hypothetical protein
MRDERRGNSKNEKLKAGEGKFKFQNLKIIQIIVCP